MTAVDVRFKYGFPPTEAVMRGIDRVREVYGIRRFSFNQAESTVRIEYDATRLNEDTVFALFRSSGLDLTEKLALV